MLFPNMEPIATSFVIFADLVKAYDTVDRMALAGVGGTTREPRNIHPFPSLLRTCRMLPQVERQVPVLGNRRKNLTISIRKAA